MPCVSAHRFRIVSEQLQRSLDDCQHRLSIKRGELESAQEQIKMLEQKLGEPFEIFLLLT
jgi:hypothetical protein